MISVLTGENSFMLQQEVRRRVDVFVREHGDMALERIDGEEVEVGRISEAVQSLPFLASKKLVIITRASSNKAFQEKAESILADIPDETDVVLVEPKLDKRTAYYKFLKKLPGFTEYAQLEGSGLAQWLMAEAKQSGGSLSPRDAQYLIDRVGTNQQLLQQELQKLLTYNAEVSRQSIELLTDITPTSTTFDLLDAALSGNKAKALALYAEQRAMRVEPQQIVALLGWQLHVLAVVKSAGGKDPATIAKEAKLNPYVVRKSSALARQITMPQLKNLIASTLALDGRMKSEAIDADEALQNLIISLK